MNTEDERVVANPRENYPAGEYLERPATEGADDPEAPAPDNDETDEYLERKTMETEEPPKKEYYLDRSVMEDPRKKSYLKYLSVVEDPRKKPYLNDRSVMEDGKPLVDRYTVKDEELLRKKYHLDHSTVEVLTPEEPAPNEGGSMDFNEPFQVEGYQEEEDPFEYIATTDAVSDALIRTEFGGRIAGAEEPPPTSTDYLDKVTSLDSMVMPTPQAPLATPQGSGVDWSFLTQPPQNVMATPKEEVPGAFDIDGYLKNNVYSNIQDSVSFTPEDDYDLPADIETAEKSYQKFKADNPEEAQNIDPRAFFVGSKRLKSQVNKDNRKALLTAMNMAAASGSPYAKYKNRVLADMFGFKEEMEPAVQVRPNPLTMDPRSYRMKADGTGLELDPLVQPTITTELDKKVPTGKYIDPQTVKDPLMRILYKKGN